MERRADPRPGVKGRRKACARSKFIRPRRQWLAVGPREGLVAVVTRDLRLHPSIRLRNTEQTQPWSSAGDNGQLSAPSAFLGLFWASARPTAWVSVFTYFHTQPQGFLLSRM